MLLCDKDHIERLQPASDLRQEVRGERPLMRQYRWGNGEWNYVCLRSSQIEWVQIKEPMKRAALWRDEAESLKFMFAHRKQLILKKNENNLPMFCCKNHSQHNLYLSFKDILKFCLQQRKALKWSLLFCYVKLWLKNVICHICMTKCRGMQT